MYLYPKRELSCMFEALTLAYKKSSIFLALNWYCTALQRNLLQSKQNKKDRNIMQTLFLLSFQYIILYKNGWLSIEEGCS